TKKPWRLSLILIHITTPVAARSQSRDSGGSVCIVSVFNGCGAVVRAYGFFKVFQGQLGHIWREVQGGLFQHLESALFLFWGQGLELAVILLWIPFKGFHGAVGFNVISGVGQ